MKYLSIGAYALAAALLGFCLFHVTGCADLKSLGDGVASNVAPGAPAPVVLPVPTPGESTEQRLQDLTTAINQVQQNASKAPAPPAGDNKTLYTIGSILGAIGLSAVGFLTGGHVTGSTVQQVAAAVVPIVQPLIATISKQSDQLAASVPADVHATALAGLSNSTPTSSTSTTTAPAPQTST